MLTANLRFLQRLKGWKLPCNRTLIILTAVTVFAGGDISHAAPKSFPAELSFIILQELVIQEGVRKQDWPQVYGSIDRIMTSWKLLSIQLTDIPAEKKEKVWKKILRLKASLDARRVPRVEKDFLELQGELYDLYSLVLPRSAPELTFFHTDLGQMEDYLRRFKYEWILEELKEMERFTRGIRDKFARKGLLVGSTKLHFKYFDMTLKKTVPAVLDKDDATISDNIRTIQTLVKQFSDLYEGNLNVEDD